MRWTHLTLLVAGFELCGRVSDGGMPAPIDPVRQKAVIVVGTVEGWEPLGDTYRGERYMLSLKITEVLKGSALLKSTKIAWEPVVSPGCDTVPCGDPRIPQPPRPGVGARIIVCMQPLGLRNPPYSSAEYAFPFSPEKRSELLKEIRRLRSSR